MSKYVERNTTPDAEAENLDSDTQESRIRLPSIPGTNAAADAAAAGSFFTSFSVLTILHTLKYQEPSTRYLKELNFC